MFCISTALARTSSLVYKLSGMFSPFFINFWLMQRTFIISPASMVDCRKTIVVSAALHRTAFERARTYSCSKLELEESLSGNCRLHLCCDAVPVLSIIYYLVYV